MKAFIFSPIILAFVLIIAVSPAPSSAEESDSTQPNSGVQPLSPEEEEELRKEFNELKENEEKEERKRAEHLAFYFLKQHRKMMDEMIRNLDTIERSRHMQNSIYRDFLLGVLDPSSRRQFEKMLEQRAVIPQNPALRSRHRSKIEIHIGSSGSKLRFQ